MNDSTPSAPVTIAQSVSPLASPDSLIEQFGAIINAKLETSNKATNATLARIEDNTSILKKIKLSGSETRAITAKGSITRTAPLSRDDKGRFLTAKEDEVQRGTPKGRARGPEAEKAQDRPVTARRVSREEATAAAEAAIPEKKVEAKPVEPKERGTKEGVQSQAKAAMPAETGRDRGGRFVGKSKSQEARAEQGDKSERSSILQSLKNGFEGIGGKGKSTLASNAGTLEEAAGRAAGGPFFEAAMEIKGAVDSARDEDGMIGKAARKLGEKVGFSKKEDQAPKEGRDDKGRFLTAKGDETAKIIDTLKSSENEDEKRHEELIKAILKGGKGETGESMGLPSLRKTGPGSTAKEKRRKAMKKGRSPIAPRSSKMPGGGGGSLLSKLPLATLAGGAGIVVAGAAAAYALSQVAQAITTGESDINNAFNALVKRIFGIDLGNTKPDEDEVNRINRENMKKMNERRKAQGLQEFKVDSVTGMPIKPGAVATAFESGKGGAGTISTGKNDAGGASYGNKQLASAGGDKSPVAQFVKQSSHAKEFKGLTPGTPAFDQKWKEIAAKDKNFGEEQDTYVAKTMSAPVIAKAVKGGFKTEDVGIREALISQSVNHGPAGNKKILASAQAELVKKYGTVEAAPATDQIDALTSSRKQYVNNVAANKEVSARKRRAKGDEKGARKAEGEAKQLRSMAGAGGRYEKENAITKALSASGGIIGGTAIAQKSPSVEAVVEEESVREKASTLAMKTPEPAPIVTATATPVADIRKRVFRKTRTRLAARGGAKSLEAKPVEGGAMSSPVAPMAEAVAVQGPSKVQQPERIQPSVDDQPRAAKVASAAAGASGESAASAPGMDKLIAMMTKMMSGKEAGGGVQQIRTEFDDTMLTLMAYDRV